MSTYERKIGRSTPLPTSKRPENTPVHRDRSALAGLSYEEAAVQLSPSGRNAQDNVGTNAGIALPESGELVKSGMVGRGTSIGTMPMTDGASTALKDSARAVAGPRAFKVMKAGGKVVLLVAVALDTWEVYEAEDRTEAAVEKAGAWAAATTTTKAVGSLASPLLGGGPPGWIAYGLLVGGAATVAYLVGGEVAETLYENGKEPTAEDSGAP